MAALGPLIAAVLNVIPAQAGLVNSTTCEPGRWQAQYFNNKTLSGTPVRTRCASQIDYEWGWRSPIKGVSKDNFSVRWTLSDHFSAGNYRFTTVSDDGMRLRLDPGSSAAKTLIDHWTDHGATTDVAQATLTSGQHTLVVDYYDNTGWSTAKVAISPPTVQQPEPVPTSQPTPQPQVTTPSPSVAPSTSVAPSPSVAPSTSASPSPSGSSGVPARAAGYWWADLLNVPLGSAGCNSSSGTATANALTKQWDYWDNCGASVVSVSNEGLPPTPWGGDRVVRWHKPAGDSNVYQKLNRTLNRDNWPSGTTSGARTQSPADVSGRYIAYQYIPSARFRLNPGHGWVILNEFKENYYNSSGAWRQDSTWGVACNNFSSAGGVQCALSPHTSPKFSLSDITDRWVKWEYRLYQGAKDTTGHGGRIELYVNDKLVDTGYNSERRVGSAAFSPLSSTLGWIWIAGQYTSNQTTNGVPDYQNTDVTSYVGLSTVLPLP